MPSSPKMSQLRIDQAAAEIAEKFAILEPKTPAAVLAARLVSELEDELASELSTNLMTAYFEKLIRGLRRKRTERAPQLALFEHLPLRILGNRDKTVKLENATYADVRRYCWSIGRKYRDRKRNDGTLKEAQALLKRMRAASSEKRGVTVGEVLGIYCV